VTSKVLARLSSQGCFSFAMEEDPDFRSPKKKKRRISPNGPGSSSKRFCKVSDDDMAKISKEFVPTNTKKNTDWAVSCFREWRSARNTTEVEGERLCPEDLLENPVTDDLDHWLAWFVVELRNQQGRPYAPRSIHQILCGLQHYMLDENPSAPKIMDKDDPRFRALRSTVDNVFRQLRSQGIGTEVQHAPVITADEEEQLWLSSVLTITTPKGLQRAVYWEVLLHSGWPRTEKSRTIEFSFCEQP
jgi:hypothetical protein